jgi:hypothetical protein
MTKEWRIAKQMSLRNLLPGEWATTLIYDLLERDANVLLTPTWIAQAQKAYSQQMFMEVERDTLWAMARQLMVDLIGVLTDETARIWAGTALALLDEADGTGAVAERVEKVKKDPAATPRGHYEEGMHGYFRGLQFLIKSVFDVRLDPGWCRPIQHFVFPWSALTAILEALRAHPHLPRRWEDLHRFYTVATGEPDCVAIAHLLDQPDVQPETVVALARELNVPQINRKMGIGVQGLAERFTRHGVIFEHLKETFLPDVTREPIPRDSVYAVVNMQALLYGFEHPTGGQRMPMLLHGRVGGLLEALSSVRHQPATPFFDQFLMAQYELVVDLPAPDVSYLVPRLDPAVGRLDPHVRRRLNAFAANLTSLLELSILSAKQPMKVVARSVPPPSRARVYMERLPRLFFEQLGRAGQTLADLCQEMIGAYGRHPVGQDIPFLDRADPSLDFAGIYRILADLSDEGRFAPKDSQEWFAIAPLVESLKRNPNVTADAYRHVDPGEQYFLQWCTAMASFEAQMSDGTPVEGGELLFLEGWNDVLVPGRRKPLTNSAWRKVLAGMTLDELKAWTPAPVP